MRPKNYPREKSEFLSNCEQTWHQTLTGCVYLYQHVVAGNGKYFVNFMHSSKTVDYGI